MEVFVFVERASLSSVPWHWEEQLLTESARSGTGQQKQPLLMAKLLLAEAVHESGCQTHWLVHYHPCTDLAGVLAASTLRSQVLRDSGHSRCYVAWLQTQTALAAAHALHWEIQSVAGSLLSSRMQLKLVHGKSAQHRCLPAAFQKWAGTTQVQLDAPVALATCVEWLHSCAVGSVVAAVAALTVGQLVALLVEVAA